MNPRFLKIIAVTILLVPGIGAAQVDEDVFWDESFGIHQPDGYVDVIVEHDGYLYVGGNFRRVDDITVNYIARFDGERWEALDTGVGTPTMGLVHAIVISGNTLIAGGMFDQIGNWAANNIARYDIAANRWYALGSGMDRAVRRIRIADNGDIYAVGEFTTADGQTANAVARYDGNRWHGLGAGLQMQGVRAGSNVRPGRAMALATQGDGAYVGGMFETADGNPCANITWWDGSNFHPLGSGTNGLISVMAIHQGQLYVGGTFTKAGGVTANSIARWDGTRWWGLGAGIRGSALNVRRIFGLDDKVYVGGEFSTAGSELVHNLAIWDGAQWCGGMGSATNDEVKEITKWGDALYIGGNFTAAGGKDLSYFTRWVKDVVEVDGFASKPMPNGVMLEWTVKAWAPVAKYRLHRGNSSDGEMSLLAELDDLARTTYVDKTISPGETYRYQFSVVREDGREVYSAPTTVTTTLPSLNLEQNYPNPFNPTTTISYSLSETAPVRLAIYDVGGRLVRTLIDETISAGERSVEWDGRNDDGVFAGTGMYFYRLDTGGEVLTRKMALVK